MLYTITAEINRQEKEQKEINEKTMHLWKWKHALVCASLVEFSKVIMRVFASCGVQLVENQYLATQWHSID